MNLSGNFKIEITSETQVKAGKKQEKSRGKQVKERNKEKRKKIKRKKDIKE